MEKRGGAVFISEVGFFPPLTYLAMITASVVLIGSLKNFPEYY